jgi:hypothetical protein
MQEVPDRSVLPQTDCCDRGFSLFSSGPPDKFRDFTSNYAKIASFHILSESIFINNKLLSSEMFVHVVQSKFIDVSECRTTSA